MFSLQFRQFRHINALITDAHRAFDESPDMRKSSHAEIAGSLREIVRNAANPLLSPYAVITFIQSFHTAFPGKNDSVVRILPDEDEFVTRMRNLELGRPARITFAEPTEVRCLPFKRAHISCEI